MRKVLTIAAATRLIEQGAVSIDGVKITTRYFPVDVLKDGSILRVGRRTFYRIKLVWNDGDDSKGR